MTHDRTPAPPSICDRTTARAQELQEIVGCLADQIDRLRALDDPDLSGSSDLREAEKGIARAISWLWIRIAGGLP